MIRNVDKFSKFENGLLRSEQVDVAKNFRIIDALYYEAAALGIFPLKNPLEGLETAVKIAKAINHVSKTAG